ncbi:hypothetical protein ACOSP7_015801 [Xanthoceras sorbifolium]
MEGEIRNFMTVWFSAFASLSYCYIIDKIIPKKALSIRLFAILPTICLLLILPLNLHSIIISGFTIFFLVSLTNLKLLLLAFDKGPLSSHSVPPLNFIRFIAVACFPIKIRQNVSTKNNNGYSASRFLLLLAVVVPIYVYKENLHQNVLLSLYCIYVYVILDLYLDMVRHLVQFLIGVELEPQFNKPHLSTSLQDFWGRRWNVMVSDILRWAAYNPVRSISSRLIGEKLAKYPAILATFFLSGLMHELQFYYYGREKPRWDVTCFFLLHGLCVDVEIALKSNFNAKGGRRRSWWLQPLPRLVAAPLVVVFTVVTASWLFIPGLLRNGVDVKVRNELIAFKEFVEEYCKPLYLCFSNKS